MSCTIKVTKRHLNTSHVKVQACSGQSIEMDYINLNTSHVKVQVSSFALLDAPKAI